jgi:hypothetical protein
MKSTMKTGITVIELASAVLFLSTASVGHAMPPEPPEVRVDQGSIHTTAAQCKVDADELISDPDGKMAAYLCKLRVQHSHARDRLRGRLAKLVAAYKDFTNHDHAKNLPTTLEALQRMVGDCVEALDSQQYCHNIVCATWPEENLTLCENKAADVVDTILRPGLGSLSIVPVNP